MSKLVYILKLPIQRPEVPTKAREVPLRVLKFYIPPNGWKGTLEIILGEYGLLPYSSPIAPLVSLSTPLKTVITFAHIL